MSKRIHNPTNADQLLVALKYEWDNIQTRIPDRFQSFFAKQYGNKYW